MLQGVPAPVPALPSEIVFIEMEHVMLFTQGASLSLDMGFLHLHLWPPGCSESQASVDIGCALSAILTSGIVDHLAREGVHCHASACACGLQARNAPGEGTDDTRPTSSASIMHHHSKS